MRDRLKQIAVVVATVATVLGLARLVRGDDEPTVAEVAAGIRELQPAASDERAALLADVFHGAGHAYRIDPLLLVALGFRESSLLPDVEHGTRRGALGELGLLQTHGAALRYRPADCTLPLAGAYCQVRTGAAWLAEAREHCGGSWWRWVGAYGLGRCPGERHARDMTSTRRARALYCQIADCDRRWPR